MTHLEQLNSEPPVPPRELDRRPRLPQMVVHPRHHEGHAAAESRAHQLEMMRIFRPSIFAQAADGTAPRAAIRARKGWSERGGRGDARVRDGARGVGGEKRAGKLRR